MLDETYDGTCAMAVKKRGMLRVSVKKLKALTVKMEIVDTEW